LGYAGNSSLAQYSPCLPWAAAPEVSSPTPTMESGFCRIVQEHAAFVWRTLRHLGVRDADVEDACQDVFLVAHRRHADFRGDSTIRTWIYGICVRVASEHRRRACVRREVAGETPVVTQPAEQVDQVARRETWQLLARILDRLDEDKRAVFVLYEIEELTMKDVARAIDCPLQTAYSRLHAARRQVAEALAEFGGHHAD
jgi:RNA polymerase sigma-70 factor (ECF subfamily)